MKQLILSFALFICFSSAYAQSDFSVSPLFGENMVLQSGKAFTVNGTGLSGDRINIEIITESKTYKKRARVNKQGEWFANFAGLPANTQCSFKLSNQHNTINFSGVKTGDIWLIVGGSNTVHLLGNSDLFEEEKAQNEDKLFHYITIPKASALMPQTIASGEGWQNHSTVNLAKIPSIAYYFGKHLALAEHKPLGIINCGYGGSLIETWMSANDLGFTDEALAAKNKQAKQQHSQSTIKAFQYRFPYPISFDKLDENRTLFAAQNVNDASWDETRVPETFEDKGLADFDGVVWFRKEVNIPHDVSIDTISIGYVDDSDEVYINGQFVGGIEDGYGIPRVYPLPKNLIKPGKNSIAIRVQDIGGGGGLYAKDQLYFLSGNKLKIDISGQWKYRVESLESDVAMNDIRRPGMVYNQMLNPLTQFPVKGIIWYQGEVEAETLSDFSDYSQKLKTLITSYRREFKDKDLPFFIVQLPSIGEENAEEHPHWMDFKYAQQALASQMPNTKIISSSDLINATDKDNIHLSNHKAIGDRLATLALSTASQNKEGSLCPEFFNYSFQGTSLRLSFKHVQSFVVEDAYGYIRGFEIAGADKLFQKVQAKIINKNKILIPDLCPNAVYVRYCGRANATDGNLYNSKHMPLMPFTLQLTK